MPVHSTRDTEDVISIIAVITLLIGLIWLVLVREKLPAPSEVNPFSQPEQRVGGSGGNGA